MKGEIKPTRERRLVRREYDSVHVRLREIFKIPSDEMPLSFEWDKDVDYKGVGKMEKEKFGEMVFLNLGKSMVRSLEEKGYKVNMAFNGGSNPEEYGGAVPDIVAKKDDGKEIIIVEVVTKASLNKEDDIEEVKKLSKFVASQPDGKTKFYLMVPKNELEAIKKVIAKYDIYVNSFYHLNL